MPYRYLSESDRAGNALSSVCGQNLISVPQETMNTNRPVFVAWETGGVGRKTHNSDSWMMVFRFAADSDDLREVLAQPKTKVVSHLDQTISTTKKARKGKNSLSIWYKSCNNTSLRRPSPLRRDSIVSHRAMIAAARIIVLDSHFRRRLVF